MDSCFQAHCAVIVFELEVPKLLGINMSIADTSTTVVHTLLLALKVQNPSQPLTI